MVDQQPIGKLLFDQWCEVKGPKYERCVKFLDAAKRYEVETDEQRMELANKIKKDFMCDTDEGGGNILCLPEMGLVLPTSDKLTNGHKDLFAPCVQAVKQCLAGEPFKEFAKSMYFHRYLQWKWLEAQPITYKTFRMYRVLGKGGFGEVCACQASIGNCFFLLEAFIFILMRMSNFNFLI